MKENRSKAAIVESIRRSAALDLPHTCMNVLAAGLGSYGLLADSTAVVIGAMIVAMLLNPILGVSMGLAESDHGMIRKSAVSLAGGLGAVFVTAFIIGWVHHEIPITRQIELRTAPNFLDLMIALAGGAAGAYATVALDMSVAFVGVAVATALVPPLSSCAILLARGDLKMAEGAMLLTFTNIVAIQFAASVVFSLLGFRKIAKLSKSLRAFLIHDAPSLLIVLALAVVLTMNFKRVFAWQSFETTTRGILKRELAKIPAAYLTDVRFDRHSSDHVIVRAVVRSPSPPSAKQVAAWEAELPPSPERQHSELHVRHVDISVIGAKGLLFEDAPDSLKETD